MIIPPMHRSSKPADEPCSLLVPSSAGSRKMRRTASAALVGFVALAQAGAPLFAAPVTTEDKPAYSPKSEGFTRESMAELSRPVPPPAPERPLVSPRVVRSEVDSKDFVPHHVSSSRRIARTTETDGKDYNPSAPVARRTSRARPDEQRVAARARARQRNPAESFVFWWNGWVIRTFHTRVGTVMLSSIGSKG